MASSITNASAIAAVDAVANLVDVGATDPNGDLKIYAGTIPADADTALTGQTLLSTLQMSIPAFAGGIDAAPGGRAVANAIADDTSAAATGAASFFRVTDRNNGVVYQGTVTVVSGGGDLELNSVNIQAGATVSITSLSITMPET